MYQIEVKRYLIEHYFPPERGWDVCVDIDAMEKGKGQKNVEAKLGVASESLEWFESNGVTVGAHPEYGRVDIAATHRDRGLFLIEVEGSSSKQKEQAMYSALGQTLLLMHEENEMIQYGIAVPNEDQWKNQTDKIPQRVRDLLNLKVYLVGSDGVAVTR